MTEAPQLTRRRAETRERLMEGAVGVFAERGILGSSVEEICERAGFTRGAFYSNFSSRDDLVFALLEHETREQIARADEAIAGMLARREPGRPVDPAAEIQQAVAAFAESQPQDPARVLAVHELRLYAARNPQVRRGFLEFEQACQDQVVQLLHDALDAAGLEFTVPTEEAVTMVTAMYDYAMFTTLLHAGEPQAAPLAVLAQLLSAITRPRST